jgi:hypothetical protein
MRFEVEPVEVAWRDVDCACSLALESYGTATIVFRASARFSDRDRYAKDMPSLRFRGDTEYLLRVLLSYSN